MCKSKSCTYGVFSFLFVVWIIIIIIMHHIEVDIIYNWTVFVNLFVFVLEVCFFSICFGFTNFFLNLF